MLCPFPHPSGKALGLDKTHQVLSPVCTWVGDPWWGKSPSRRDRTHWVVSTVGHLGILWASLLLNRLNAHSPPSFKLLTTSSSLLAEDLASHFAEKIEAQDETSLNIPLQTYIYICTHPLFVPSFGSREVIPPPFQDQPLHLHAWFHPLAHAREHRSLIISPLSHTLN